MSLDLEAFREIFADYRTHIAVGRVEQLDVTDDKSLLRVKVVILPEEREVIAMMSWEHVGPSCGIFAFPAVNDLVLVAFADGNPEHGFVIRRLTSKEDRIPVQAVTGDSVIFALAGKKAHLLSDTRINLGRGGGSEPEENVVLGQVLKEFLADFLDIFAQHTHTGNLGYLTTPPMNAAAATALKASPVNDEEILSDVAFTEK